MMSTITKELSSCADRTRQWLTINSLGNKRTRSGFWNGLVQKNCRPCIEYNSSWKNNNGLAFLRKKLDRTKFFQAWYNSGINRILGENSALEEVQRTEGIPHFWIQNRNYSKRLVWRQRIFKRKMSYAFWKKHSKCWILENWSGRQRVLAKFFLFKLIFHQYPSLMLLFISRW